jgi:PAS domain S-box-containing protein
MATYVFDRIFVGATEMARLHRALDWGSTPLGSPERWQEGLRTLVPIMLTSKQPMFIVWGEERTLLYNDAYAGLLGHKHPQALGQDFLQVWHEIRADLEPIVARAYRGESVQMDDIELWMERRGFREETHFQFFYAPVRDDGGLVCGYVAACTEITAHVLAERALAVSEARHRGVLANMDEGFCLFDRDFTIQEVNEATTHLVGLPREDIIGRNHWDRFPGTQDSELGRMYLRVLATQQKESCEFAYQYPDGRHRWYEIRAFPVQESLAVLFRDITERRQMLESLQLADRRKDEFLAMLAHELRNPLAPIRTAAELLMMDNGGSAQVRHSSAVISRQVQHLTSLVDDLLDVSRVTRGLVTLDLQEVDMAKVVADAVEQARPLLAAKRHQLAIHLPSASAQVMGDSKRLLQVLSNLLNNAGKYTPDGGHITVRVDVPSQETVRVSVKDNGMGMSAELADQAFELFTQADRTLDRTQGGLGIGLALVRSLTELHHGSVQARSAGRDQGSEFILSLPRLHAQPSAAQPQAQAIAPPAGHPLRVLVVDDNEDAARMLATFLEMSGHQVMLEFSARRGLARALAQVPDVCLLDIGLPEMDGLELARQMRAQPALQHTKLVAITGYGQEQDRQNSAAAGFDHHWVKPVDPAVMTSLLASLSGAEMSPDARDPHASRH